MREIDRQLFDACWDGGLGEGFASMLLPSDPSRYAFKIAQYQQVGNAVPPLLANQIAEIIYEMLGGVSG